MCGLVGLWRQGGQDDDASLRSLVSGMADAIAHRGPDDQGIWSDAEAQLSLGHRRLAIVDLSSAGHQPMHSHDGRFVIVFNGEIYNFKALRQELGALGVNFRSSSDTEVMLAGFSVWGVRKTVERLAGMFAFALWDQVQRCLHLCRDRLGKKPLYVMRDGAGLAFASELKAFWRLPGFKPDLSPEAVEGFFRFGYVAENLCIFENCFKVQPGELVTVGAGFSLQRERYWSLADVAVAGQRARITDMQEAKQGLLDVLRGATRERMVADVPLGAFLSGGIDSGLVVALMQEAGQGRTRTFSIGFEESSHDEAPVAKAVAAHLGTDHTELYVSQRQAMELVPRLADVFDEPFADASQIPTALLAALTRRHVTVAMTGDGGDEAFGGYVRYRNELGALGHLYGMPRALREGMAASLLTVPSGAWDGAAKLFPARRRPRFLASKVHKLSRALACSNPDERGRLFLTLWERGQPLNSPPGGRSEEWFAAPHDLALPASERMQFWEAQHYLPGDLLVKMDRATMASSLEARSPLLDHRVVEFAWRLMPELKAGPAALKHVLRETLFDYVPRQLVDLPKQGFSVPIGHWMLDELRPFAEEALAYGRENLSAWLDWTCIDSAWKAHVGGTLGYVERLWAVLMFAHWHRRWFSSEVAV